MNILAIDPGNIKSAYVGIYSETYKPIFFDKIDNNTILKRMRSGDLWADATAIEMIASYGMSVGQEVFDTCVWIGRFDEACGGDTILIPRKDIKMNLCNSTRAKDANVRQALIDRFGIVGTKKNPGWFYGFHSDIWSAYAVAVTYLDNLKRMENK